VFQIIIITTGLYVVGNIVKKLWDHYVLGEEEVTWFFLVKLLSFQVSVILLLAVIFKTTISSVEAQREKALKTFYMTMCLTQDTAQAVKHYKSMIKNGEMEDHLIMHLRRLNYTPKGGLTPTTPDEKIRLSYNCESLSREVAKTL
jgi:hypothetical protein